ncbi:MAG: sulfurtransferase TusA family protein [Selenomonadaceae bacterium]|nr:sulfurtransferase TusA family protein [Selenomonadaceae bacterium]
MNIKEDEFIDITDLTCPITFVKTKITLEDMEDGQILKVRLNDGEPVLRFVSLNLTKRRILPNV